MNCRTICLHTIISCKRCVFCETANRNHHYIYFFTHLIISLNNSLISYAFQSINIINKHFSYNSVHRALNKVWLEQKIIDRISGARPSIKWRFLQNSFEFARKTYFSLSPVFILVSNSHFKWMLISPMRSWLCYAMNWSRCIFLRLHIWPYGAIGSASDSRSEGWVFKSLWGQWN